MLEETASVVDGVRILKRILGVKRALVGIESNKPDAAEALTRAFAVDREVEVVTVPVKYLGRRETLHQGPHRPRGPAPARPADGRGLRGPERLHRGGGRPRGEGERPGLRAGHHPHRLDGEAARQLRVRLGTLVSQVVEAAGGLKDAPTEVVMGGPMMGVAMAELEVPVVKATSGFVFLADEVPDLEPYPCIRCNRCVTACPLPFQPAEARAPGGPWANLDKRRRCTFATAWVRHLQLHLPLAPLVGPGHPPGQGEAQ